MNPIIRGVCGRLNRGIVVWAVVLMTVPAYAFDKGDVTAGKAEAATCAGCHGAAGVSPTDTWPNLAGQGYLYLVKQLRAFHDGIRKDPLMGEMAKPLSDRSIQNLAAYLSSLPPGASVAHTGVKRDLAAAKRAVIVNGCVNCHGENGMSLTDAFPNLAGQGYSYIVKQLRAFRAGTRVNVLMAQMAKPLSDRDIQEVAAYFSSLAPGTSGAAGSMTAAAGILAHPPIIRSAIVPAYAHPDPRYWATLLPPGNGQILIRDNCQLCHDLQRVLAFARPRDQWQQVVAAMRSRGSPLTPQEAVVAVNYLATHLGPQSPSLPGPGGGRLNVRACRRSEWPTGSSEFRGNWKGRYNIWVSNMEDGSIDVIDPVTRKIVDRIRCVSSPDRVEFSRDGNTAYVPDRVEHNITVINTGTGAIEAKIPLIARPNTAVRSRDFRKLYAGIWPLRGNDDSRGYVQILDTSTLKIVKTIETQGGIHDTWMSPDGKILLAMSPRGRFMNVYDTQSDKLLYTCCTRAVIGTMAIEAAADGSTWRFFIGYTGFNGIVVIDAKTGKELMRVKYPPIPESYRLPPDYEGFHGAEISSDGGSFWCMHGSIVYRYALPSLKFLGEVRLSLVDQMGRSFTPEVEGSWLTISPDGTKVYAVRPGRNLLSVIDVKTMKEEALIPTGQYPLHISIWPRGTP